MVKGTNSTASHINNGAAIHNGLVTTAIHTLTNGATININGYSTLRGTICVVTTKHVVHITAFDVDGNTTVDVGSMCSFAQSTTIQVTADGSTIQVNLSGWRTFTN